MAIFDLIFVWVKIWNSEIMGTCTFSDFSEQSLVALIEAALEAKDIDRTLVSRMVPICIHIGLKNVKC